MSDALLTAVRRGLRIVDLGRELRTGMPQSHNHPQFWHTLPRRHGDTVRPDGGSAANDLITTGTHVGTHIDALAHVSQDGLLHGGVRVEDALEGGKYVQHGVHTIEPMIRRGVLLDVPAALGEEILPGGFEITAAMLDKTAAGQGVAVDEGDVVLIRTAWGRKFAEGAPAYMGHATGVPGPGQEAARWLADRGVHATGADTIAYEVQAPGAAHAVLPAHRVLLVEQGIYILEALDLEELAAAAIYEFTLVAVPLPIFGATGSPIRPLAVVTA
ncbi:cyclase family protein [uncultured Aeromicrobium sp.]|uniref:cyclase family protein n=1 Tax=uncultured Aeromicrobium sp. TaxID=337820 RepID=UPI0025D33A0F|nr:cyclase family protein [uncultured Aeromicrobium sp.]